MIMKTYVPVRRCVGCGRVIDPDAIPQKRFCSTPCYLRHYNRRPDHRYGWTGV
jgi:predicted nucleic acid-binding Zn ribbon protein